jgi:hypothetical protein
LKGWKPCICRLAGKYRKVFGRYSCQINEINQSQVKFIKMKQIFAALLIGSFLLTASCNNSNEIKPVADSSTLTKEIAESENRLFSLLRQGKVSEAFAMHINNPSYQNILAGISRTHSQMDAVLKQDASNNIRAYDYVVSSRDFLIVNDLNVLETVGANRKLISANDSIIENRPVILSILWTKVDGKWNVAYLHSSYKASE